jgi:hypothetical protein
VHVDGGSLDNEGLLAMIRRKVQRIVVFINTADPISDQDGDDVFTGLDCNLMTYFTERTTP